MTPGGATHFQYLERIGDLAENIAKRVPMLADEIGINEATLQLQRMADLVRELGQ